jgi:hyperosmotically inducible protein
MIKLNPLRALTLATVALSLATACASTRTQKTAGEAVDDAVITAQINSALIGDPLTKARDIDVEVFKGRVQLNGFVDSDQERLEAISVARKVGGVTTVDNNLKLKGAERTAGEVVDDAALTAKVKSALAADERTNAHQINVETRDAVVLLAGFVNNAASRAAANDVAMSIGGVSRVDNQLAVK